ncbi:MAG: phage holin family protein [Spirochaetales bacterium]|nr:phage holin family protein [Spirochaetales bacterium]
MIPKVALGTGLFTVLIGAWDTVLEILLVVMAVDYITGVSSSFRNKRISSALGHNGLIKKANIFLIVILAAQLDKISGNSNYIFRNCTAVFFIANDAISIIENVGEMGIRLPKFLKNAFVRLQNHSQNTVEDLQDDNEPMDSEKTEKKK